MRRSCSTHRTLVVIAPVICVAWAAILTPPVRAEALKIQFLTKVNEGEKPRLRLQIIEPIERLAIDLSRDDGPIASDAYENLAPGTTRELLLPADPGKHHFEGRMSVTQNGTTRDDSLAFDVLVASALRLDVDRGRIDLTARRLEVKLNHPASHIELKVYGPTQPAPGFQTRIEFGGAAPGTPLPITWPTLPDAVEAARIDLRAFDTDGFYVGLTLTPWSVRIPHQEVNFATDTATIAPAEAPKLAASLKLISDALAAHRALGAIKLYIAGHTDRVGKDAYNQTLSLRRSQAIATWFRKRGLRIPIRYEGLGENAPLVATPDETAEPRNRRVDYILSVEDPALATAGFRARWKTLR